MEIAKEQEQQLEHVLQNYAQRHQPPQTLMLLALPSKQAVLQLVLDVSLL